MYPYVLCGRYEPGSRSADGTHVTPRLSAFLTACRRGLCARAAHDKIDGDTIAH
jgi:hypothetical protein